MPEPARMTCSSCGEVVAAASRFCPGCGGRLDPSAESPTRTLHRAADAGSATPTVRDASAPSSSSSDSFDHGRFVPGTLLLDRYRILGLLGRGGMGEVYRADDLKLGQTVALKFLPPDLARDPGRLARFHNEVRLARQVSHPNVCRVYDLGESGGQPFLSMEYIDGEDLSTLLRRIGRLPADKATEVGRQVCAGLAAAHERGVVHRDLKPGNIMIDGRGRARIADFGLAGALGAADGSRAGTPAYMAPEQLEGGEAGVKSDLFALGLVLYELYTGRRAFRGDTWEELSRSRETGPPSPTSVVEGLDPAVERAILRCLETDPRERPAHALAVAAALPGGDPLAMALAAGETPSPEMVAAAGETGGLRPALVGVCLAAIAVTLLFAANLARTRSVIDIARPPKPPEVLLDRAHEVLKQIGYPDPAVDSYSAFGWHRTYLEEIEAHDPSPRRWERLAQPFPPALYFIYRQSPFPLEPLSMKGAVDERDPPPIRPGMVAVTLTADGRLWRFDAVPPQNDPEGPAGSPIDWQPLFAAAGVNAADMRPSEPRWGPAQYADERRAWEGATPGSPEIPLRIEAAAYRGRAIAFNIIFPWTRPLRAKPFQPGASNAIAQRIILSFIISSLVACGVLARKNLTAGRGDRRGAFRLGAFIFLISLVRGLCGGHHLAGLLDEWGLFVRLVAGALFNGAQTWLLYIAIEPFVRRNWPDRIVSWSRLLGGRPGDPLVGRDILVGVAFGSLTFLLSVGRYALPAWLGRPAAMPDIADLDALGGLRAWVPPAGESIISAVEEALVLLVILVLMRIVFRRPWAAALALLATCWAVFALEGWDRLGPLALLPGAAIAAILVGVALRHGLLAVCACILTNELFLNFGLSLDWGTWYARPGVLALLLIAGLTAYSTRAALAGRSLFELRLAEA